MFPLPLIIFSLFSAFSSFRREREGNPEVMLQMISSDFSLFACHLSVLVPRPCCLLLMEMAMFPENSSNKTTYFVFICIFFFEKSAL